MLTRDDRIPATRLLLHWAQSRRRPQIRLATLKLSSVDEETLISLNYRQDAVFLAQDFWEVCFAYTGKCANNPLILLIRYLVAYEKYGGSFGGFSEDASYFDEKDVAYAHMVLKRCQISFAIAPD